MGFSLKEAVDSLRRSKAVSWMKALALGGMLSIAGLACNGCDDSDSNSAVVSHQTDIGDRLEDVGVDVAEDVSEEPDVRPDLPPRITCSEAVDYSSGTPAGESLRHFLGQSLQSMLICDGVSHRITIACGWDNQDRDRDGRGEQRHFPPYSRVLQQGPVSAEDNVQPDQTNILADLEQDSQTGFLARQSDVPPLGIGEEIAKCLEEGDLGRVSLWLQRRRDDNPTGFERIDGFDPNAMVIYRDGCDVAASANGSMEEPQGESPNHLDAQRCYKGRD